MFASVFFKVTRLDFDIISTVDHPYICPPIRLLDSHNKLFKIKNKKVCILNWDVSLPNNRTYRYDLQLDLLFLAKNSKLFLFDEKIPYALQNSKPVDIDLYRSLFEYTLYEREKDLKLNDSALCSLKNNYDTLEKEVFSKIAGQNCLVPDYTKEFLIHFYKTLNNLSLGQFINDNYLYYFNSTLCKVWIPFCIENATGKRSIESLLDHKNIFSRRLFRPTSPSISSDDINSIDYIKSNKKALLTLIKEGEIIPSIELLYWSLELAGKQHFGNDYDFFNRYNSYLNKKNTNQITSMYKDGVNILEVAQDYGISLEVTNNKFKKNKSTAPNKLSRINSMSAIYILLGGKINQYINMNQAKISFQKGEITVKS